MTVIWFICPKLWAEANFGLAAELRGKGSFQELWRCRKQPKGAAKGGCKGLRAEVRALLRGKMPQMALLRGNMLQMAALRSGT